MLDNDTDQWECMIQHGNTGNRPHRNENVELDGDTHGLDQVFVVLVARDLGVLLASLCHELRQIVLLGLRDRLWL